MTQYPPNINPGVKNDRGRIILILIITGLAAFIFQALPEVEKIWNEISTELQSEFGLTENELFENQIAEESNELTEPTMNEEPDAEVTTPPPYNTSTTTTTNFTIDSDLSEETARQIFLDSREQIIQQLREQGQEHLIPMVLEQMEHYEASFQ